MTRYADLNALRRAIADSDVQLVTDGQYTTAEPTPAARQLVQAGVHDEYTLQKAVFEECDRRAVTDDRWGDIYANVNGQYRQGQRMEPGLKKGVPDIFVAVPVGQFAGMYLELKWKGGHPSREQMEWIARLRRRGYKCVIVWDEVEEVIAAIADYLEEL